MEEQRDSKERERGGGNVYTIVYFFFIGGDVGNFCCCWGGLLSWSPFVFEETRLTKIDVVEQEEAWRTKSWWKRGKRG